MKGAKMHLVREQAGSDNVRQAQGLAGWLLALAQQQGWFAGAARRPLRKHMRVVETLPMGPRRNLYLVSCDGERFLVGTGTDSIQTITRVRPESAGLGMVRGGEQGL